MLAKDPPGEGRVSLTGAKPKEIKVETFRIDYLIRTPKVEKLSLQPISLRFRIQGLGFSVFSCFRVGGIRCVGLVLRVCPKALIRVPYICLLGFKLCVWTVVCAWGFEPPKAMDPI